MKTARRLIAVLLLIITAFTVAPAMAEQPCIGIIYTKDEAAKFQQGKGDPRINYRKAIVENKGRVVEFFQGEKPELTLEKFEKIQGLIVPGGIDIDPKFYNEERREKLEDTDENLDKFEMWIIEKSMEKKLPILGICRGHQLLNVFGGGSMYQDIPTEYKGEKTVAHRTKSNGESVETMHLINLTEGSLIARLLKVKSVTVNSYHHQGVKNLAQGYRITARTEDGFVEAMEKIDAPVLGVQFHPEMMRTKDPRFNALFQWLIQEAKKVNSAVKVNREH